MPSLFRQTDCRGTSALQLQASGRVNAELKLQGLRDLAKTQHGCHCTQPTLRKGTSKGCSCTHPLFLSSGEPATLLKSIRKENHGGEEQKLSHSYDATQTRKLTPMKINIPTRKKEKMESRREKRKRIMMNRETERNEDQKKPSELLNNINVFS